MSFGNANLPETLPLFWEGGKKEKEKERKVGEGGTQSKPRADKT
jgi:hypothetical protein